MFARTEEASTVGKKKKKQMAKHWFLYAWFGCWIPAVLSFSLCSVVEIRRLSSGPRVHSRCPFAVNLQASSRASKETGMEQLQKQWGAPELSYIEPVFRPPAEAGSLILQVTNGCSWNKCTFCEMYTSEAKKFRLKPLEVLEHEITLIARMGGGIEALNRVFLGDGDAMMLPFDRLVAILGLINKHMPWVKRISSYCLPRNIRTKTVEQLNQLKAMGLTTLYVGCESGDNEVLSRIQKGETFASSLDALNKIHAAGVKSSVMILTGLGGSELSEQHALNSALLVSSANPTYLSTLILTFPMGKERFVQNFTGFTELSPLELLAENRKFIEATDLKKTIFRSDHASNYLPLAGVLGKDKTRLVREVDAALAGETRLRPDWMRGL